MCYPNCLVRAEVLFLLQIWQLYVIEGILQTSKTSFKLYIHVSFKNILERLFFFSQSLLLFLHPLALSNSLVISLWIYFPPFRRLQWLFNLGRICIILIHLIRALYILLLLQLFPFRRAIEPQDKVHFRRLFLFFSSFFPFISPLLSWCPFFKLHIADLFLALVPIFKISNIDLLKVPPNLLP